MRQIWRANESGRGALPDSRMERGRKKDGSPKGAETSQNFFFESRVSH
jgi:hypothetical protein